MKQGMFGRQNKTILISPLSLPLNEPYTIIVTGVQRGGTSMVAGVLGELGIDMGPSAHNHEDVNMLTLKKKEELQAYIDRRNEEKLHWGFKLPGAHIDNRIRLMKFRNPIWLFVFRNVVSNTDSLVAHGAKTVVAAYERIVDYYKGIADVMKNESSKYVLVSYDKAAVEPDRFVAELADVFQLQNDVETLQRAAKQVTGDGGGYLPQSRFYHFVAALPPELATERLSENCIPLKRGRTIFREIEINFQDAATQKTEDYIVQYPGGQNKVLTVTFDFGEGFTGLATYHFPLNGDTTLVRVHHEGAVRRIGFGNRLAQLPPNVSVLRCPAHG